MSGSMHGRPVTLAVAALLTMTATDPTWAQPRPDTSEGLGRGFLQVGALALDVDALNARLTTFGHPALDGTVLTLGGGGYGTRGRFLFGGEGHAVIGSAESSADGARRLSVGGGYGMFRVGYLALSKEGLDVYPGIGIGVGEMSLEIAERDAPTFDEVLASPERSSTLSTGMFLLDASVGVNYRIVLKEEDDGRLGGLLLGVHVGYLFAPGDSSWELDGINDVAGGPALQIEGFWIRFTLGGWGTPEPDRD